MTQTFNRICINRRYGTYNNYIFIVSAGNNSLDGKAKFDVAGYSY